MCLKQEIRLPDDTNPQFLKASEAEAFIQHDPGPAYTSTSRAEVFEKARSMGLTVVAPGPNQLQLDIDNKESREVFDRHYDILQKHFGIIGVTATSSKSGGERQHITVTLARDVTPLERVGLQAMMGSDRKRELLSFARILYGDEDPTVFFEPTQPSTIEPPVIDDDIPF
jgi:hypothetical protein